MAFEEIPGMSAISSIDFVGLASKIGTFFLFVIIAVFVAGIVGLFYYKKNQKVLYKNKIHFFEEVNGHFVPTEDVDAAELVIPNTNIRVFYIKSKDLYMPRGTRKMGKDAYWYGIRNNREIVNFTMKNLNKDMVEAGLEFDHTDMRYAYANLQDLIKRNYKDKSVKWWKEYKDVISTVIFVFVMSLSMFFLLGQISKLIGQLGPLLDRADSILQAVANLQQTSGVVPSSGVVGA